MSSLTGLGKTTPKFLFCVLLLDGLIRGAQMLAEPGVYSFDWDAYMEMSSLVLNDGERDYSAIRGDTGWLVYPAGHVWVHAGLYKATSWDHKLWTTEVTPKNISGYEDRIVRPTQVIYNLEFVYLGIYLLTQAIVLAIYHRAQAPAYATLLLCVSRRLGAIYFLGFFNDSWAMLLAYASVLLFAWDRWTVGCIFFSLAVSVKMNVLLFAPPLALLLVMRWGAAGAVARIGLCALVQLLVGAPFLLAHPASYIAAAFNFGRKFNHVASINFNFLPEDIFSSNVLAIGLLVCHVGLLLVFASRFWTKNLSLALFSPERTKLNPAFVVLVLFGGNMIGIAFARSMHYQFLSWYFHCIPLLVAAAAWHPAITAAIVIAVEICWNEQPPTATSSFCLMLCHVAIIGMMCMTTMPPPTLKSRRDD